MSTAITAEDLVNINIEEYCVVDIRNRDDYEWDHIAGALPVRPSEIEMFCNDPAKAGDLPVKNFKPGKKFLILGDNVKVCSEAAEKLNATGFNAVYPEGGYGTYLCELAKKSAADEEHRREIEGSITKTFKKDLFSRFTKGIVKYELVEPGDKIAVCISGGKDSMCMAMLFKELQKHHKFPFEIVFLCMDPGYNPVNRRLIENNAKLLGIPLTIFNTEIFDAVYTIEKSPCYLCARMRRGYLYSRAKEMGCNKIALGHHFDDVIETVLMGMLYSGQFQAMMPKLHSTNFEGMELIRPMYLVREDDIKRWRDFNNLHFLQCACRFTENCVVVKPEEEGGSKRLATKQLIAKLKETNPNVENNLLRSTENIPFEKMLGIKINGEKHAFTEYYDVPQEELADYFNRQIEKHYHNKGDE